MPPKPTPDAGRNRLLEAVSPPGGVDIQEDPAPPSFETPARPVPHRDAQPRGRRRAVNAAEGTEPDTVTIYMSEAVQKRLKDFRHNNRQTSRDVVFAAVAACHDRLAEVIAEARVSTAPENPLFPTDPKNVRYLGGGGTTIAFKVTPEQDEVLTKLTDKVELPLSTWLAPVLNDFLPGRKERKPKTK